MKIAGNIRESKANIIPLEDISIANPCHADWNRMLGDDRVRFCQSCAKNVYNLSAMSHEEAVKFLMQNEGDMCLRLYRRSDGTVITDDCPVVLRSVHQPFHWLMTGLMALLATGMAWRANAGSSKPATKLDPPLEPVGLVRGESLPRVEAVEVVMGRRCYSHNPPKSAPIKSSKP